MTPIDFALIAIVLISAVVGLVRGLLREVVAVLSWVLALWLAWQFGPSLEPYLGGLLQGPQVRPWAARVIIVIVVLLVGTGVGALLGHFVRLSIFNATDRLFGFVFGTLRGVLLIGVLVMLGQLLRLEEEPWWKRSRLMPQGESIAAVLWSIVREERASRASELI